MTIQEVSQILKRNPTICWVCVSEKVGWDNDFPSGLDSSFTCEFQEKGQNRRVVASSTLEELLEIVEKEL